MTRRRWIYRDGVAIEVTNLDEPQNKGPFVVGEIEAYESPASGQVISSRAQRREDFKRTGTRPWEGKAVEMQEVARRQSYEAAQNEQRYERAAATAWRDLPERYRRTLQQR